MSDTVRDIIILLGTCSLGWIAGYIEGRCKGY